ncbi:MAG: (Fe-S)-binding protein [Bacillota bacterium]
MAEVNMEQLLNCAYCPNMCRNECPVVQTLGREAVAPSGKARTAALIGQGYLEWSEEMLEALANCLGCRGCTIHCPFDELNLCDELLFSRIPARSKGVSLPATEPYLNNLRRYSSPYGQKTGSIIRTVEKPEVLVFNGCTALANNPASIESTASLLEKAGVSFCMVEEDCCGYPAEVWGDLELARQLAYENKRKFTETGASILVTNCPECWSVFNNRYREWEQTLPLGIIDGLTYFLQLMREGRLKPEKEVAEAGKDLTVSYHDPCIWARTAGKTDEPREILRSIPGLVLKEPAAYGAGTRCCGGGSMFQLSFPETASAIAKRRLTEFPAEEEIVTACPFCREGLKHNGKKVSELVELLNQYC